MVPGARPVRHILKFLLPPSLGSAADRLALLEDHLSRHGGRRTEVAVSPTYEALAKDLLAGRADAAWAPPYVCARVESMGARIVVRGVRGGASTYRAALVGHEERPVTLDALAGKRAAWVDPDSVAGFLLAQALLRARGTDPQKTFFSQVFAGSYQAAVDDVASGRADLTSVFAPAHATAENGLTGLQEIAPELASRFQVVAVTDPSPNDGVAVSPAADPQALLGLERVLLTLGESAEGLRILREVFHAEAFEPAPRMGYRTLYRVALSTL